MKKINLIKTLGGVGVLGIAGTAIPLVAASCSCSSEGINVVFNTEEDADKWFKDNMRTYNNPATDSFMYNPSESDASKLLEFFVTKKHLWGLNMMYREIMDNVFGREEKVIIKPLKLNLNFDENYYSFKYTDDFVFLDSKGKTTMKKNSYRKINITNTSMTMSQTINLILYDNYNNVINIGETYELTINNFSDSNMWNEDDNNYRLKFGNEDSDISTILAKDYYPLVGIQ